MTFFARLNGTQVDAKAWLRCLASMAGGFLIGLFFWGNAFAASDPVRIAAICESAASQAAQRYGIPVDVMRALTLTETGRKMNGRMRPWPWTVNVAGKGYWFETRAQAVDFISTIPKQTRSYDIGCFQINWRWHGEAFASQADMFDPVLNADYAARFLRSLLPEFKTWRKAAGAYHSRTPKFAERYEKLFDQHLAAFGGQQGVTDPIPALNPETTPVKVPRNLLGQPLAWESDQRRKGSLVDLRQNPNPSAFLSGAGRALY